MPNATFKAALPSLPERMSARLFAGAKSRHLDTGDILFAAGDPGDGCYRLERGLLKIIITSPQGEDRILAILGPGQIAGEPSIIDRQPRSVSVVAIKDCELKFISQQNFEKYIKQDPDMYRYLINVLAARLRETIKAVAADSFLTVKARLARALLKLAEYLGEDAGAGRVLIRHKINQTDLAAMAGVARENVSRVLGNWKRHDLVSRSSGFYYLNDVMTLQRYADARFSETARGRRASRRPNTSPRLARPAATLGFSAPRCSDLPVDAVIAPAEKPASSDTPQNFATCWELAFIESVNR
jgi:CRP/FNR family transcriptional regulator, cyclic AMP receptor protein